MTSISDDKWMLTLNRIVLEALQTKWEIRCKVATESTANREHSRLYNEALSLWNSRSSHKVLAQDLHLTDDKQSPDKKWGTDTLRNWIMTRKLAMARPRFSLPI